jgi:hypothetical protein
VEIAIDTDDDAEILQHQSELAKQATLLARFALQ